MDFADYRRFDGLGLAELVRTGEVTAGELLETAIGRAEAVNGQINAIVLWMTEIARERARLPLTGLFAGVPFLVKDLNQDYAGTPTSRGSAAWRDVAATEHADVVSRWLDAGLVVFGKTNTPEFGAKATTEPLAFGPTRNPWDLTRIAGGSSGGAAAAVAAGVVPVAGASDGGGSIRIPAACCGLLGLKPSRGLVPAGPMHAELMHGASTHGVISRSVRDTAAMLDCLVRPVDSYLEALVKPLPRLRIGYTERSFRGVPSTLTAVRRTADLLAEAGHDVTEADPGIDGDALAADFLTVWYARIAATVAETRQVTGSLHGLELDSVLAAGIGRSIPAPVYVAAQARWHDHTRALAKFHQRYDVLLTPTVAGPAPPIGALETPRWMRDAGRLVRAVGLNRAVVRAGLVDRIARTTLGWAPFTQLANVTGCPAVSVPADPEGGLPLGVHFVAPNGGDALLLRLAAELEEIAPWAHRHPSERNFDEAVPA
ncbi:amidase [Lentzea kentuckyensis]|uniref:amidase n=1 Tax=Lentzea kentuckyensis TaxID=360086 RepID=UPI000A3873D1|nr:amidase [Lentzea kentuckyensis]